MIKKHEKLVEACAMNDRNAQFEIYDLYYKAMFNTSLRIVNDSFSAEDIMQESFLDAFSKIESFEWRSSFGSWLKRIVVNKSIDLIKKNNDTVLLNDDVSIIYEENLMEDSDNIKCKLDKIDMALKEIPKNYKVVLVLYLFEGYDHQEISQILNIPYNNVRVRYLRAKRSLVEKIKMLKN